jgi:hypothetical protein
MGITRGVATLIGAAVAGFLIWLATQMGDGSGGEYWATYGLIAAAGLTMALSQILGGWTKWGWPRLSLGVFLIGFLPVLLVGGWVLLAAQPADFLNTSNWSRDLGIGGVVDELAAALGAVAFGIGLTLGLTFDTVPRQRDVVADDVRARERVTTPGPVATTGDAPTRVDDRPAADEPLTAERSEQADAADTEEERGHRFGLRRRRPVAANPEPRDEV